MTNLQYGYSESNPLPEGYHDNFTCKIERTVDWADADLDRIVRFRLLSDAGFPAWDVSYCHGVLKDGTPVEVSLPFDQLPKRGWKRAVVEYAKKDGVYAAGLGMFANASTLV